MERLFSLLSLLLISNLLSYGCMTENSDDEPRDELNDTRERLIELGRFLIERDEDIKEKEEEGTDDFDEIPRKGEIFEGDIVMDNHLRSIVLGQEDKRSAIVAEEKKWPNQIIPYQFLETGAHRIIEKARWKIKKAIKLFRKFTCMTFIERTPDNADEYPDFVQFRSIKGRCSSFVGRQGGLQNITIGKFCTRLGTVQHEMMHSMGTIHEQSRPDRNKHVKVYWENIKSKQKHNFHSYDYSKIAKLDVPYNFESVMHYPNHAFSKNDEVTLAAKSDPDIKFGQRKMMTCGDVLTINRLYQCNKRKGGEKFNVDNCNKNLRGYDNLKSDHYDEPQVTSDRRNYPIDDGYDYDK